MGRYRVNVECSQKLPQTKSEYFTHCSYEVQAISKGVGCLPLAPAEVEKRIQTVLQAPAMPESWERRRAR